VRTEDPAVVQKVFLSHSFADEDRPIVALLDRLIRSQGLVPTTGRLLAGGPLPAEIAQLIDAADATIALMTLRRNDAAHVTHPWVEQEYGHAVMGNKKPSIALIEHGVHVAGVAAAREHVLFDRSDTGTLVVRASETIAEWKRRAGRLVKVLLMPERVATEIGQHQQDVTVEYRYQENEKECDWVSAIVRREIGGVLAYLRVPENTSLIQVRSRGKVAVESEYTPLRMTIELG
jgi:hypothetical protein